MQYEILKYLGSFGILLLFSFDFGLTRVHFSSC